MNYHSPGVHRVSLRSLGDDHSVAHSQQKEELSHGGAHWAEVGLCSLHQHLDVQIVEMFSQLGIDRNN